MGGTATGTASPGGFEKVDITLEEVVNSSFSFAKTSPSYYFSQIPDVPFLLGQ